VGQSLAELREAISANELPAFLNDAVAAGLSEAGKQELGRIVSHDRHLWSLHPNSMASCLLGRLLGNAELAELRSQWLAETIAADRPWIECLQPLQLAPGTLATLFGPTPEEKLGCQHVRFLDDDTAVLEPWRGFLSQAKESNQLAHRITWNWRTNATKVESCLELEVKEETYPKFEHGSWGDPPTMMRESDGPKIALPIPDEASADACLDRTGRKIIVSGHHDEYAGGFVWIVSLETLEIERKLETKSPVWNVSESADGTAILARTSDSLVRWTASQRIDISLCADESAISPNGELAVVSKRPGVYQVLDLKEAGDRVWQPSLPTKFSPSGDQLLRNNTLYQGSSGTKIADLDVSFDMYLEGGPTSQYFHLGDQFLINLQSSLRVWNSTGALLDSGELFFPYWYHVAYDHAGARLAACKKNGNEITVYAIPSAEVITSLSTELTGCDDIALSADGTIVAIAKGAEIEVRTLAGELLLIASHPCAEDKIERRKMRSDRTLLFTESIPDNAIYSHVCGEGWRLFDLDSGESRLVAAPKVFNPLAHLPNWQVSSSDITVFETPGSEPIALPLNGKWVIHPHDSSILACHQCQVKLREP